MPEQLSDIILRLPFQGSFGFKEITPISEEELIHLQQHELEELEAFTHERRKREYVSSRTLLKELASEWNIPGDRFEILKDALGRPYGMYKSERYFVSIAHTDNYVFCGISQKVPIGVDAEPVERGVADRLKKRIMHPKENRQILQLPAIRIWTIKEAFIKLEGQGLRLNMNQVQLHKEGNSFSVEINNDKTAKICSFRVNRHWLAIAYYY